MLIKITLIETIADYNITLREECQTKLEKE